LLSLFAAYATDTFSVEPKTSVSRLVLTNDIVRYEFEAEHTGLAAMVDLATGINHIQTIEGKHTLWKLTFCHGTQKRSLSSTQVPCSSYEIKELPNGLRRAKACNF
jgi:hypothetical protein